MDAKGYQIVDDETQAGHYGGDYYPVVLFMTQKKKVSEAILDGR